MRRGLCPAAFYRFAPFYALPDSCRGGYYPPVKPSPRGKTCEARPVDETASKAWRRGQKFQGVCRRNFWAPQEDSGFAARQRRMRFFRFATSTVGRGLDPAVNMAPAVLNWREILSAHKAFPFGEGVAVRRRMRFYRLLPFTVGRGLGPAERPPLSGEGNRVSGGRVGTVSLLLYYPHLFLRKETVVTARESGDRPLLFATANSSPIKGRRQAKPCKMSFARCERNGVGGARPDSGSRRPAQIFPR